MSVQRKPELRQAVQESFTSELGRRLLVTEGMSSLKSPMDRVINENISNLADNQRHNDDNNGTRSW